MRENQTNLFIRANYQSINQIVFFRFFKNGWKRDPGENRGKVEASALILQAWVLRLIGVPHLLNEGQVSSPLQASMPFSSITRLIVMTASSKKSHDSADSSQNRSQ